MKRGNYSPGFIVPSDEIHIVRIHDLQRKQQQYGLQLMRTVVDEISIENIRNSHVDVVVGV